MCRLQNFKAIKEKYDLVNLVTCSIKRCRGNTSQSKGICSLSSTAAAYGLTVPLREPETILKPL